MIRRCLALIAFTLLTACGSRSPAHEPATVAPTAVETPIQDQPARPEAPRSCDELTQDADAVIAAHDGCSVDAECAMAAAACPGGFACGRAVRASDVAQVNAEVGRISDRYKAQCNDCIQERVRCRAANPVCREGRCVHEAPQSECERLDAEAEALIGKYASCNGDADCTFARGSGGCPTAFACGAVVNKAQEQAFVALAAPLSRTFATHCGACMASVAECRAAKPVCSEGRCARRVESP